MRCSTQMQISSDPKSSKARYEQSANHATVFLTSSKISSLILSHCAFFSNLFHVLIICLFELGLYSKYGTALLNTDPLYRIGWHKAIKNQLRVPVQSAGTECRYRVPVRSASTECQYGVPVL